MKNSYNGPYRATVLWNEAVLLLRENIILKEHRHRFHKHKNSFSGSDAVTSLLSALCSNPMFNPSISREQCCRLLRQFLLANFISPVTNCSLSHSKTSFYDSNKYLYEFTEELVNFEPILPASASNAIGQKFDKFKSTSENEPCASNTKDLQNSVWKIAIIQRLNDLLKPLDVCKLFDFNDVNSSWVEINANPELHKQKWNAQLPEWILSAIQNLIKYTSKDYCGTSYPNFEVDSFQVISDYFKTLDIPLIETKNYNIYAAVYHHLEYLNCMEVVKSPKKNHNYGLNSREVSRNVYENSSTTKVLPPNHCYETAFTSDDPTVRVVPQSSIDSIHLKQKKSIHHEGMKYASSETNIKNIKGTKLFTPQKPLFYRDTNKQNYIPLKNIENFQNYRPADIKHGIVNEGFVVFSPDKIRNCKQNLTTLQYKSYDSLSTKRDFKDCNNFSYVNHALSFSLEDINLLAHNNLDYDYALKSLNNLMKVTKHNQSSSDDDHSFHTALSESEFDLESDTESSSVDQLHHTAEIEWDPGINELGSHIFQLLLLFLPPSTRAKLKHVCALLFKVSKNSSNPEFSLHNMFFKLNGCLLKGDLEEESDLVKHILTFIINNYKSIFSELSSDLLTNIKNELFEQQLKKISSCNQLAKDQFNTYTNEESENSLKQLLDHILQNKSIPEKEKRKHLKLFKECYPKVYRSQLPQEQKPAKTKMLFSIKNLRL